MSNPLFSAIIPTFNRAHFLAEAIESILDQTCIDTDYEIIVVDDGSTDNTEEIIKKYAHYITYHRKPNSGVASCRNVGVHLASGEYLCYLDSDDLWKPDKLSVFKETIKSNPAAGVIFSDFIKHNIDMAEPYDLSNTDMFNYIYDLSEKLIDDTYELKGKNLLELLLKGYPFYPSSFAVKRLLHRDYLWDPGILKSEDFNLVLKLSRSNTFIYIDKILTIVRVHDSNKSSDYLTKDRTNITSMKLFRDLYKCDEPRSFFDYYISRRYFQDGKRYLRNKLYKEGFYNLFMSMTYSENWYRLVKKLIARVYK